VRSQPSFLTLISATLTCAILAGCTGASTPSAARPATAPPAQPPASSPHVTGQTGSPGNPLILSCAQEAFPGYADPPIPPRPQPGDLVIGPLFIVNGRVLATESPAQYGYASYGRNGRSYKIAVVVTMGSTVTVTIAAPARGHVVINNPYAYQLGIGGLTSATYRSCAHKQGFFAQGFAFPHGQARGCVPLDVTIGHQREVHHVTLSLFAGTCAA
jgi:hypothetical protein